MVEAVTCFTYLADNAPSWVKSLEELESKIQKRASEVARIAVPVTQNLKRTSSNESIRNSPVDTSAPSTGLEITSAPQPRDVQQAAIPDRTIHPTPSRKRKTMSLISAASGAHKYRSRNTIIVYYDGDVQAAFDKLVRNISTSRNNIRKSRMADRVPLFTRMETLNRGLQSPVRPGGGAAGGGVRNGTDAPNFSALITRGLRTPGGNLGVRPPPRSGGDLQPDARDLVDEALDRAQGFCEKGAHQFLRDGDCIEEIAGARAAFEEVRKISEEEVERLKSLSKEREEREMVEREQEQMRRLSVPEDQRIEERNLALLHSIDIIEADDDDEDEDGEDGEYGDPVGLPSPPFRLMTRT